MSKPKWTPGPWRFDRDTDTIRREWSNDLKPGQSALMGDYRGGVIASIADSHGGRQSRDFAVPEAEANARLIAAAPELKDALSEVFQMIEDVRTGKIERGVNFYLADAQAVILEAIAKAEGRE